jgi:hypothetical protein
MVTISPRIGALLTRVAETPDIETALWKVLLDYVDLKLAKLSQQIADFEAKWDMPFTEFSKRIKEKQLPKDAYSFEVEKDFWDWEKAETLLKHYTLEPTLSVQ